MTWTDPKTWTDQELVTAELLNAQLSGNLEFLHDDFPPKRAWMWHINSKITAGNPVSNYVDSSQMFGFHTRQYTPANGDSFTQSFFLQAGTYTFKVLGRPGVDSGKVDWAIDGVNIVTGQDWYDGTPGYNVIKSVSDVVVSTGGVHVLRGTVNGKAGASSDYYLRLTAMWFEPSTD